MTKKDLTDLPYLNAGIECLIISFKSSWGTGSFPGQVALRSMPSNAEERITCEWNAQQ
jgi:hypothetical protein